MYFSGPKLSSRDRLTFTVGSFETPDGSTVDTSMS
jgi:hypothetical protein